MRLGLYLHLGPIINDELLAWAADLRASGVSWAYSNLPIDPMKATADQAYIDAQVTRARPQLEKLRDMDFAVAVRPMPLCIEQIVEEVVADGQTKKVPTPNFRVHRTSLEAASKVPLLDCHYLALSHEIHDTADGAIRRWLVDKAMFDRPNTMRAIHYYGRSGLWIKEGADFGDNDMPHCVHVSLNAASGNDASSDSPTASGPNTTTGLDIAEAVLRFKERIETFLYPTPNVSTIAHINVLPTASVERIKELLTVAAIYPWQALLVRTTDEKGGTLTENKKHVAPPNVLQAIKDCQWLTK